MLYWFTSVSDKAKTDAASQLVFCLDEVFEYAKFVSGVIEHQ
jgi:hypothetical protein